ncbi:TIGR01777 family oxidoreductase [Bacillaceae bacterium IKA-2]|jgi:uncharacterized protein (TIGR01777 family)|nr:TIGR01777 family oxidoreductase [Bacillaceae bacterium IKA-2]
MNVVIAGGTGLIGSQLVELLLKDDHHIYILTRNADNKKKTAKITYVNWLNEGDKPETELQNIDVVVNLAGQSINNRWTATEKKRILSSRISATKNCLTLIENLSKKPNVFLNASAVGFYGTSQTNTFTEADKKAGTDFLASVVEQWEAEAIKAEKFGIRTVFLRFGVVLAKDGGALNKMLLPYKFFAGGTLGSGQQWLSWVHIDDAIKMIQFSIENEQINGPINITAPNPERMENFGKTLATVLNKPHWLPAPSLALKLLLGEMSMLILKGQKAIPKKAENSGYHFQYPELDAALKNLL